VISLEPDCAAIRCLFRTCQSNEVLGAGRRSFILANCYQLARATYPLLSPGPSNSLLGLAGGGVCPAGAVTGAAVRSYRTISPLPPALTLQIQGPNFSFHRSLWTDVCFVFADSNSQSEGGIGCVVSVALSLGSPPVAVSHHRCPFLLGLSSG
jgi:hypothetical protein